MDAFIKHSIAKQFLFLQTQIENLSPSFLIKRHIPEKWSVQEHLAHLGRYQETFLERLRVMMKEDSPYLKRYKADDDKGFYEWCKLDPVEILKNASIKRQEIIDFLNNLSPDQLKKTGIHPKLGAMNINDWISFFLLHESHHIYAIFGLKHRFYKIRLVTL